MEDRIRNIVKKEIARNWGTLCSLTYELRKDNGEWEEQTRELYDRGHGVTILLYNPRKKTIFLTRQFRIPVYLGGHPSGFFLEACAGKLDVPSPEECIIREVQEETGLEVTEVTKIFELFMSPGSVSEKITFFTAAVTDDMKTSAGGGLEAEQEHIEVLELQFSEALGMVSSGEIADAKTVILLQFAALRNLL